MPSLGADMDEGTLVEWLVTVGDTVHRGDIVAVVDTTKSAIEVEVFADGVVTELLVEPGTTVPVGTALARIDGAEPAPDGPEPAPAASALGHAATAVSPPVRHLAHQHGLDLADVLGTGPDGAVTRADVQRAIEAADRPAEPASGPTVPPPAATERVSASPLARRRASELGVVLATVRGTGPSGAVTAADVERSVPGPAAQPPSDVGSARPSEPGAAQARAAAMRATIANLMARSKREIPHYYLRTTVDFQPADDFVRAYNAGKPPAERLLPAAVLLKAAAVAMRKVPELNGFFDAEADPPGFRRSERIHLGVAVALRGGGLVAPAIHDADTLSLTELMAALKDLVARTRAGRLRGSQMSDPTVTVTNLGDQGVEVVHGVIYPPQVALVGFGTVVDRPWAVEGMLTVRPVVTVTLAADHRVSDGHRGGRYLRAVEGLLAHPEQLETVEER